MSELIPWSKENWLELISETDGIECPAKWFDHNLEELIKEGRVTRSSDSMWHRLPQCLA